MCTGRQQISGRSLAPLEKTRGLRDDAVLLVNLADKMARFSIEWRFDFQTMRSFTPNLSSVLRNWTVLPSGL